MSQGPQSSLSKIVKKLVCKAKAACVELQEKEKD